jgi:ribosomal protein L29
MKTNKERDEIKQLNAEELHAKLDALKQELFSLKLKSKTAHVKDYSQFKKLRANVARAKTYLHQRSK